jgi:hypothetical protein
LIGEDVAGRNHADRRPHDAALCPIDQNGNNRVDGDVEKFYRASELVTRTAVPLLPFQSPRLSAVAIAPVPPPNQRTIVRVTILDQDGRLASRSPDIAHLSKINGLAVKSDRLLVGEALLGHPSTRRCAPEGGPARRLPVRLRQPWALARRLAPLTSRRGSLHPPGRFTSTGGCPADGREGRTPEAVSR